MVGVARIELATPAMSTKGANHKSTDFCRFMQSKGWSNGRTNRDFG